MGCEGSISLTVLGTDFLIDGDDPEMVMLLADLWRPFLSVRTRVQSSKIELIKRERGWCIDAFGALPVVQSDFWSAITFVSGSLFRKAILDARRVVPLHAAVATRGSVTVVLAGASGVGKTTLVLKLLNSREGWRYLSDDLAPILPGSGHVLPFPKPLSIKDNIKWQDLARQWRPPDWVPRPKQDFLIPGYVLGEGPTCAMRPTHLVFLRRLEDRGWTTTDVPSGLAVARCAGYADGFEDWGLRVLSEVCTNAEAVELKFGSSSDAVEGLRELVEAGMH